MPAETVREPTSTHSELPGARTEGANSAKSEMALVGYQVAVDLWTNQGSQGWARFNVMLVLNGIIAAASSLLASQSRQSLLTIFLPITGLLICAVWFVFVRREASYSDYYVRSARELEEKYLSDVIKTISRGHLFAEGEPVTIEIGGGPVELRMSAQGRLIRARHAGSWLIGILAALYVALIVQALLTWF